MCVRTHTHTLTHRFGAEWDAEVWRHRARSGVTPFVAAWMARSGRSAVPQPYFRAPWLAPAADRVKGVQAKEAKATPGSVETSAVGGAQRLAEFASRKREEEGEGGERGEGGDGGGQKTEDDHDHGVAGAWEGGDGGVYAFMFVHKEPLDFIFQVKLLRKFVQEEVSVTAVLNLDELDPEYHRTLTRWRHVATALNVRCMHPGAW